MDIRSLSPNRRGYIAELYVKYRLAREDITVCMPPDASPAFDLLVLESRPLRCEVKGTTAKEIGVGKTRYTGGVQKLVSSSYKESDRIDFFILVDLNKEDIFIVPAKLLFGSRSMTYGPNSLIGKHKDRFDLLR